MKGLITICARGGSKGVPKKNIKEVNGIPLIAYSINIAKKFSKLYSCDITLSTDDSDIKNVALTHGLRTTYTRPKYLSTDQVGKIDVKKDKLSYHENENSFKYDYVLDLEVSTPMSTLENLTKAFIKFQKNNYSLNLFSVSNAHKNPYFNMVEQNETGFYSLCKDIGTVSSRQSSPKVYELNASFYFYKRPYFNNNSLKVINSKSLIYKQPHTSFDIDEQIDFDFFQFLIENNKLPFDI